MLQKAWKENKRDVTPRTLQIFSYLNISVTVHIFDYLMSHKFVAFFFFFFFFFLYEEEQNLKIARPKNFIQMWSNGSNHNFKVFVQTSVEREETLLLKI